MIELAAQASAARLDLGEVGEEAGARIDRAAQHDARGERMAVQAALAVALGRAREMMRGVEAEFLVELDH